MSRMVMTMAILTAISVTVPLSAAPPAKEGVTLTIYNGNYAMVKDVRTFELAAKGAQVVKFRDVASKIDATSVAFRSLTDPKTSILEQNYEYDLVSADKLLAKYIDKTLSVLTKDEKVYRGTLLSFDRGQLVLKQHDGKLVMVARADNVQNIEFGALPEGLITRPTLVWMVWTQKTGKHLAQVAYLTNDITWKADYTAVTNKDDTAVDLAGWVTINNRSGARYKEAKIKLIAGDVHRVTPPPRPVVYRRAMAGAAAPKGGFEQKAFGEYHMYTLGRPSTVNDNQVKQIELIDPARGVPVRKYYEYTTGTKVRVLLEIKNDKASKLGIPLPKGKVRVYKKDEADGSLEFIGEDEIDHTPKDEKFKLYIGNAFDLVAETKILADQNVTRRSRRRTLEIKLRNHKEDKDVVIEVLQNVGRNWKIESTTHQWEKKDAYTIKFVIPVKKDGETVLKYTVFTSW